MWHASIAYHGSLHHRSMNTIISEQTERAFRALRGVGDGHLGQWVEKPRDVIHLRRRLSTVEAAGFILRDVRGTPEAEQLLAPLRRYLPPGYTE